MPTLEQTDRMIDAIVELTGQTARLARAIEKQETTEPDVVASFRRMPSIRYSDREGDTISPPRLPRHMSWHEKVREKRVSLPAATIWSGVGVLVIELGRALVNGHIQLW